MLLYKYLNKNINILFHLYFVSLPFLNNNGLWDLIPCTIYLFVHMDNIFSYFNKIIKSYFARRRLIKLIKKYHLKMRLERKKETRNNIIKNISKDITNQVIEDSIQNLNLYEHKELMQNILENVNQFKLFNDFFNDFKVIIIDYNYVEKKFLRELSEFCKINKKDLILISQENPFKILKDLNLKFFNLQNIFTPYHYNKGFFGSFYKKTTVDSISSNVTNSYLFNQIIKEKKTDQCVFFGDELANKISKKNIMAFNIELNNKTFINILEDWIKLD